MSVNRTMLIVEDDPALAGLLSHYFTGQGFGVEALADGRRAVDRLRADVFDIVILDQRLPGLDGVEVCQRVRRTSDVPILMLTGMRGDIDVVAGLEAGVDDYVSKPCAPRVLLARVRALLRRRPGERGSVEELLTVGSLVVNRSRREVRVSGRDVGATSAEHDLAWLLASRVGTVVTRDALSLEVRGIPWDGLDRGVDIHVSRLRRKLAGAGCQDVAIRAVRSEGYQLVRRDP